MTKTTDTAQVFWDVVAVKDSIDNVRHALKDDLNVPYESMARVDLHNAKVELNKALEKLHLLIEMENAQ